MKNNLLTRILRASFLSFTLLLCGNLLGESVNCSFTQGETIYFRISSSVNWGDAGAYPAAVFYYSTDSRKDTKTNTTNWDNMSGACNIGSSNYTTLTSLGDNRYSVTIPRNDIGYIRIVRISGGDANWTWNNQNKMCVADAGTNNCIYCNGWDNTGAWETYSGGRTNTCGASGPVQTNWSFRGDMWLNSGGGWVGGGDAKVPHFMDDGNGNITCSFIFPDAKCRLTLCENGSDVTSDRCDGTTNITNSGFSSSKYTFAPTGGIKKYTFRLNNDRFTVIAENYPVQKTGWHVFMSAGDGDPTEVGTITEETGLVIPNVSNGNHNLFITDGSATTIAGVNWFGGLYIDKNNSDVSWATQRVYYDSNKFSSTQFPIRGDKDATGRFKLDATSDIIVAFDGGKITINKHSAAPEPTPDPVTFDGSEIFYFHKKGGSLNWGSVWADDCALFLQFSNANESNTARSTRIGYFWDSEGTGGNVLATRVPAGTWTKVRVLRNNNGNRDQIWNNSDYVTLEEGKDYLNDNNAMAVYSPRTFHFYLSGSAALANTGSDFNAWNGDGTAHSGSMTKLLDAGTYKFKLNPTGTVDWRSEFNMDDLDAANSSNNINLRDGNNKEIWFDLAHKSNVTISCDGSKVTVVALPVEQVTVNFMANGETFDTQVIDKGSKASIPTGTPTRDGYIFNGWDWDFNDIVNENTTVNALWTYKAIESVSLNKSSLTLFENSTPQTLTPSYLPADVVGVTYSWSVSPAGVVSVEDGVVSVITPGTATITCTATDEESHSLTATCSVTVHAGEGCVMEEQDIFSHTILGNSTTGGLASNSLPDQAALNEGMEPTCRKIKMYYGNLSSEFTADENGVVKAKSGLSDHSDEWYEIKGGTNANAIDGYFYYLKNVATGRYITRGDGQYGNNADWYYYTAITTPENEETELYQFIYTKKGNQDNQKRICSVWNYSGMNSNQTYGLHRRNQDWADNYSAHCPNPMIVFGRGENQGNTTLNVNFIVVEEGDANPDYLSTPVVYNTRSYYRFAQNAAVSLTLDKRLRVDDKIVVYCYNPAGVASNGGLYINNNKVSDISIPANSAIEFEYIAVEADADKNAIEVRSDDNNFCVAAVDVQRSLPAAAEDPALTWSAPATCYTSLVAGAVTFQASSANSSGAITYSSSDETVATVVDGVVTPVAFGTATITASIEQYLCFGESSIQYNIVVEPSLQEAIDATPVHQTLTLTHDYNEDAVINKAITLEAQGHVIGDLLVEQTGDLTLGSALTVRDFTICAKAGNTTIPAASGQVRNANNLTCIRNAYFLYTVDPSGHVQYGWYDFTVPFPVHVMSGIKGIQDDVMKENFANGVDYAIMEYFGEKQAQGQYPYKKFSGIMQPDKLYSVTLDDDYNYNTLRMQKTSGSALGGSEIVTLDTYEGDETHRNWNGVGNGTLHHADAGVSGNFIQVYQSGDKTFLTVGKNEYSLVVGSAFMVQETGTMTLSQATHSQLLAPKRYADVQPTVVRIASEGQPFSDQLFISASETGGQAYTPGVDVAKAGELGSANVPQIWTNAYNSSLSVHQAQLINGEASYNLSIYAPADGAYTLTGMNIQDGYTLYLTQNGTILSDLSGTYTLDLYKGITTDYGLLLMETYRMPTGIENVQSDNVQCTKVIHNGVLYILHNGKIYNAQGGLME